MTTTEIITLVSTLVPLIPSIFGAIYGLVKIIKNKEWSKIKEIADSVMRTVEEKAKSGELTTSEGKLNCAMELVKKALPNVKWNDALESKVKQYINSSISWLNGMISK